MKWILIIITIASNSVAIRDVEFDTLEACELAQERVEELDKHLGWTRTKATCVPKSLNGDK